MSTEGPLFVWPLGGEIVEGEGIRAKKASSRRD